MGKDKKRNSSQKAGRIIRNQDYIEEVAAGKIGLHKDTMKAAFNALWDTICEELEEGNAVKLHGKGMFYLSKRSSRIGRNPATGQEYDVPEREAMAFQTSPAYAKKLRQIREMREQEVRDQESQDTSHESMNH